jgi:superkiller protein 3
LGFVLKRSDKLQEAIAELSQAVKLSPELGRAHFHLAEALSQAGDRDAALSHYRTAARLSPANAEYAVKLGAELTRSDAAEAVQELRRATGLDPANAAAHQALGMALRRAGDGSAAAAAFQKSRDLSAAADRRAQAMLYTNKGIEQLKKGSIQEAIRALRQAVSLEPRFPAANHYLAVALSATGKWEEANPAFQTAIQGAPADPEIRFNYGVALGRQNDWSGAEQQFQAVVSLRPAHPQASCSLAAALARQGRTEAATLQLEKARELGPCRLESAR